MARASLCLILTPRISAETFTSFAARPCRARTFAYQDANYGYTGMYIPQTDYNYYFRQGQ